MAKIYNSKSKEYKQLLKEIEKLEKEYSETSDKTATTE